MVEFAIVLPLLLVLVFGIIEFGFLLYNRAMITNASREGARAGIVFQSPARTGEDPNQIRDVVEDYCADFLVTFGGPASVAVTVNPAPTTLAAGDPLTVTVVYPYSFLVIPNLVTDIFGTVNLTAVTVMRAE
ncbi:MAG: TadE/TadG family type IV pilus assembly protein [Deferrisomatales bacterium]|nr:TadE/TadG family type IV pilus assembly protein [Deferrisomatales bacterium]